jgi:hypothetical protein
VIKETHGSRSARRKLSLLQKGAATHYSLIDRTQLAGSQLNFYLFAPHLDGLDWVYNLHDWLLRKGTCEVRETLKQGEQENSFG